MNDYCHSVLALPTQKEHDLELHAILFGEGYRMTADKEEKFQAIGDAVSICIDQFSSNETQRNKEKLFLDLKERIGFSFSFDDIELQKVGQTRDGKELNVSAKTHRRYTHRGWDFKDYPLQDLWEKRKKILTATVNKVVFEKSPGFLSKIPWIEGVVYSEEACNEEAEAFCKLVYCIHILGDYEEATSYSSEFQQLIPLVRHEDPYTPALIDDLEDIFQVLFISQSWSLPLVIEEFETIKARAEKILFVQGGIRTNEQFAAYKECSNDIIKLLHDYLPSMLKKTDFFYNAFYN